MVRDVLGHISGALWLLYAHVMLPIHPEAFCFRKKCEYPFLNVTFSAMKKAACPFNFEFI